MLTTKHTRSMFGHEEGRLRSRVTAHNPAQRPRRLMSGHHLPSTFLRLPPAPSVAIMVNVATIF